MDLISHIKNRGLRVAWVARKAGVSRPTIYELAKPCSNPNIKTVIAVANVLGIEATAIRDDLKRDGHD